MRLTVFLLLATCLMASAEGSGQKLTISAKNIKLEELFSRIKKSTGYVFFYDENLLNKARNVTIDVKDAELNDVLDICFKDQPFTYSIVGTTIVVKNKISGESHEIGLEDADIIWQAAPPVISVSGTVVYDDGKPAIGVSVLVKNSALGTSTNDKGYFKLNDVEDEAILELTGVNIIPKNVSVNGRSDLGVIILKLKATENEETVVVSTGFQTISKERVTGAFGKVTDELISKRPVSNLSGALEGMVAGMVTDPNTGFVIRGRSSLSGSIADRRPLLVVDGFPIEGGFESINPNDVQSIDVLKDAAASSIYGARAANGVIVVTTKAANNRNKLSVDYNGFLQISEKIDLDNYMNIADAATQIAFEDRLYNTFKGTSFIPDPYTSSTGTFRGGYSPYTTLLIEKSKGNITDAYVQQQRQQMLAGNYKDDYNEYLFRNGVAQQHNIIISGVSERNSVKFSILYDNDKTSMQHNDNSKLMLNLGNIFQISKNLKYRFNGNFTSFDTKMNGVNLSHLKSVTSPWTALLDDDGNYTRMNYQNYEPLVQSFEPKLPYQNMRYNVLEEIRLRDNHYRALDLRIQNELDYQISKSLRFTPMFQYELFNSENTNIYDEKSYAVRNFANLLSNLNTVSNKYVSQVPTGGIYAQDPKIRRESLKFRAQLDYNHTFNTRHEVVALLGTEVISTRTERSTPQLQFGYNKGGLNYASFDYNSTRTDMFGSVYFGNNISYEGDLIYDYISSSFRQSNRYNERFFSGYANASYTFDKRYTITLSGRADASNYVSKTVREKFSPFYSAGLRWNIKNEKFMTSVDNVNRLALRATYGATGNAAGKNSVISKSVFTSYSPYSETGSLPAGGISGRDNDYLTWEKTYSINLGLDFGLFRNKVYGSVDLYRRKSEDLLSQVITSQVIQSTSSLTLNLGEVLNKGIEVTLGSGINISRNFRWDGVVNFDYNYNQVTKYNYQAPVLFYYLGTNSTFIEGLPTDRLMMVHLAGTTGLGYYVQQKKDGELIIADNSSRTFGEVGGFGMGRMTPGIKPIDDTRMYYMGRRTPPSTIGFTNTFSYKGFSLMAVITGRFGYKFIRSDEVLLYSLSSYNFSASGLASLQSPSLTATTETGNVNPTLVNQVTLGYSNTLRNYYSDAVVSDASHVRLNELYLGYQFGNRILGKTRKVVNNATLYVQARNLGLIWKANDLGIDPSYPLGTVRAPRAYTIGVRLGF